MMLVFQDAELGSHWSWRFLFGYLRKAWETKQCVWSGHCLQASPQRAMDETLRVGLKLQWRSWDVRSTRNVKHLPRIQPWRGTLC